MGVPFCSFVFQPSESNTLSLDLCRKPDRLLVLKHVKFSVNEWILVNYLSTETCPISREPHFVNLASRGIMTHFNLRRCYPKVHFDHVQSLFVWTINKRPAYLLINKTYIIKVKDGFPAICFSTMHCRYIPRLSIGPKYIIGDDISSRSVYLHHCHSAGIAHIWPCPPEQKQCSANHMKLNISLT